MTATRRLDPQPGEVIDRRQRLSFSWNARAYPAFAGDTIASALAASGETVFSRSMKYHRPRGLLTASHADPNCTVQVGDEPNVRAAHRLVEPDMDVRAQDAWPSLAFDVKAVTGLAGRFLPAGFYYKTFIRPRSLWPTYERVLRRFSHGGVVSPHRPGSEPQRYDKRHVHPDVLVAGGGPAGMAAAVAAARSGAQVLLVEEDHALGGHLRWGDPVELASLAELRDEVAATDGIEVLTDSVALGCYDHLEVAVLQRGLAHVHERLVKARTRALVVAPGLIERPYVFAGNDVPGVLLSSAVRRLVNLYAVRPGDRAVVLTANPQGDAAVADLERAGVEVVHVVDARRGGDVVRAVGRSRVRAVELADGRRIDCDLLLTAVGWTTPATLFTTAGGSLGYDRRTARFWPDAPRLPAGVFAAGGVVGDGTLEQLVEHAGVVGRAAARRAGAGSGDPPVVPELPRNPHPELFRGRTHGIVDFSEDVSSRDLVTAVQEGYSSAELAKRYTTATMGPTQGKVESVNVLAVLAEAIGRTIPEVGTTTWRPPYAPVTLGALAGPHRDPVRRSPLQPWHERNGAVPLVAGAWIRPDHYGDPVAEARMVREAVGIIDVTPIGKLDLRGPDVPKLLNLLYVNRWSRLAVGRVRYGVMCAEDGVVLDDGVTGRLGEEHYLTSTTSGGAASVWEWAESWLQTEHPDWRVHVTPVTTAYASISVAGPRSRELIARVVDDVDVSADAFPYMHVRTGGIAGVAGCVLWRIGFTGELGYELHVPAGHGLHVWERLLARGQDLGVRAVGIEAQRVLRLEKGHLIVGQDTDGLTQAHDVGLEGLVRLDKDDFAGRPELVWRAQAADERRLVGLWPRDEATVPAEGSQLVDAAGRLCGRITSSRWSPTLRRSICLGQVAASLAQSGTEVRVRLPEGGFAAAVVTEHLAAVDPEGVRVRA